MAHVLDWCAGAAAQVEVFAPRVGLPTYQFKYTPAYRATIRPPVQELHLGQHELDPVNQHLDELVKTLEARSRESRGDPAIPGAPVPPPNAVEDTLQLVGGMLEDLAIPSSVQRDFRRSGLYIELGMEEALLGYPWELMHDGDEFLCLRHQMGRFVNGGTLVGAAQPMSWHGQSLDPLTILVVSVPAPQPRGTTTYDPLSEAREETKAIVKVLVDLPGIQVRVLEGSSATYAAVYREMRRGDFQILHFNGHAYFDDASPYSSGIVLFDRDMTTGQIAAHLGHKAPVLCFINACETTRMAAAAWRGRHDVFGLAKAFLEIGSYLIGSRWRIGDKSASSFAQSFYDSFLKEGRPIGLAVREARVACRQVAPLGDFGWASYLFYGDPRVYFHKQP
jgi:hypothetical protein